MRKHVALVSLTVTAGLSLSACGVPQEDFDALQSDFNALQSDFNALQTDFVADLNGLKSEIATCEDYTGMYLRNLEALITKIRTDIETLDDGYRIYGERPSRVEADIADSQYHRCNYWGLHEPWG